MAETAWPGPMRPEWPDPPGPDAGFDEIRRYASVQLIADYFLVFDETHTLWMPEELRLSPQQAWELAEKTWDGREDST